MAVTFIRRIKKGPEDILRYIENPEKTTALNTGELTRLHGTNGTVMYASDEIRTERCLYITGIRCCPETAAMNFRDTKKHWGKEDGTMAFHLIQSFAPGETDPATAHEIGVKTAEKLWGDRFETVIGTHVNTKCVQVL